MANEETTIRIKKSIKDQLEDLDFVRKSHSYNDIVEELLKRYGENGKVKG